VIGVELNEALARILAKKHTTRGNISRGFGEKS